MTMIRQEPSVADVDELFSVDDEFVAAVANIPPDATLEVLADEANRLAESSQGHMRAARDNIRGVYRDATLSGAYLLEIKRRVGHGNWLPWLEENFCQSVSTAEAYMLLAAEPLWLQEYANSQSTGNLTLDGALKFIRGKRRPDRPEKPDIPPPPDPNPLFTFTSASLLDIAAKAEELMATSSPQDWWQAIRLNAHRFRAAPDRDFWRRFGLALIEAADADDPPDEPDYFALVAKSPYAPTTVDDLFEGGD